MKFTGQVRIPEVDHPGVPATIVVEGDQTEVFLEGETLGRWSLFDVHASRLVSSAFSLSLAGEEITFIADEPVDFAYKGVDHMAEAWARFKSMSIPRRMLAVGRSRRGTVSSRISELRDAMLYNLESAGRPAARLIPIENVGVPVSRPGSWAQRIDVYSNVPEPLDEEDEAVPRRIETVGPPIVEIVAADDHIAAIFEPIPMEDGEPAAETVAEPVDPTAPQSASARLRPGPGLIPRRVERPRSAEPEVPVPPPQADPVPGSPWEEPPAAAEIPEDEMPSDGSQEYDEESTPPSPVPEPATAAVPEASVTEGEQPVPDEATAPSEVPAVDEESGSSRKDEGGRHEVVVDLGHLEAEEDPDVVDDEVEPPEEPGPLGAIKEPVLAGAPTTPAERSGLLGAVRSAFARNRASHEHEFVEAPGGIGIVRQICAECGYISIGVTD